jgi:hypothetical protein
VSNRNLEPAAVREVIRETQRLHGARQRRNLSPAENKAEIRRIQAIEQRVWHEYDGHGNVPCTLCGRVDNTLASFFHRPTQRELSTAGEDSEGPGWPLTEIQPTVAAYFTMLRAELAGHRYVKADFNHEVQAATGRSRGAVDRKFMNISAVLDDTGLPYIWGYKPYSNFQGALRTEVERFLARDPDIPRLLEEMPAPPLSPTARLEEVNPPVMTPPGTNGHGRTTVGADYLERQARNQDIGLKGELLVVEHERAWLAAGGRPDLAKLAAHVPSTLGDGAGYDVASFLLDGSPHHIEVKATRGGIAAPFFLSAGELRYALKHPGLYSIYRVFDLGPNPRFYKLTGDMAQILDLTPVSYQARVKAPGPGGQAHLPPQARLHRGPPHHRLRRPRRQPLDRGTDRLVHQENRQDRPPLPHHPDPSRTADHHRHRPLPDHLRHALETITRGNRGAY